MRVDLKLLRRLILLRNPRHESSRRFDPRHRVLRLLASGGWHCSHFYYTWKRDRLSDMPSERVAAGRDALIATLDPAREGGPLRLQTSIVSGAKADFGLMVMDRDPLVADRVHQRLMARPLGPAITPGYSFVSVTEISEYVLTAEQYGARLVAEGEAEGSPVYQTKLKAYADRLVHMNKQRLTPDFPPYPRPASTR